MRPVSRGGGLACLALIAGLMLLGCGGKSDSSTASTAASGGEASAAKNPESSDSKASYLAAGNKVCEKGAQMATKPYADRTRLTKKLASAPSAAASKEMEGVLKQIAAAKDQTTRELQGLEAPASLPVSSYLAARRTTAENTRASAAAFGAYAANLRQADVSAVTNAQKAEIAASKREVTLARRVGLEACATQLDTSG